MVFPLMVNVTVYVQWKEVVIVGYCICNKPRDGEEWSDLWRHLQHETWKVASKLGNPVDCKIGFYFEQDEKQCDLDPAWWRRILCWRTWIDPTWRWYEQVEENGLVVEKEVQL